MGVLSDGQDRMSEPEDAVMAITYVPEGEGAGTRGYPVLEGQG